MFIALISFSAIFSGDLVALNKHSVPVWYSFHSWVDWGNADCLAQGLSILMQPRVEMSVCINRNRLLALMTNMPQFLILITVWHVYQRYTELSGHCLLLYGHSLLLFGYCVLLYDHCVLLYGHCILLYDQCFTVHMLCRLHNVLFGNSSLSQWLLWQWRELGHQASNWIINWRLVLVSLYSCDWRVVDLCWYGWWHLQYSFVITSCCRGVCLMSRHLTEPSWNTSNDLSPGNKPPIPQSLAVRYNCYFKLIPCFILHVNSVIAVVLVVYSKILPIRTPKNATNMNLEWGLGIKFVPSIFLLFILTD